jgi:hypothetical protein
MAEPVAGVLELDPGAVQRQAFDRGHQRDLGQGLRVRPLLLDDRDACR